MTKNMLFLGGPMHGRWSPMPEDSGHVVARSDHLKDPRTNRQMEWTYYRKYLFGKPAKRRDGWKIRRHIDVFAVAGYKIDQAEVIKMMLRSVPKTMPDVIVARYSSKMNGVTVMRRVKGQVKQVIVLDKELRDDPAKAEALKNLAKRGTLVGQGVVEIPVDAEADESFLALAQHTNG